MNAASSFQQAFAHALLQEAEPEDMPPALTALLAQPAFKVYRNTVLKGCMDALEANYPTVVRLVGRDWFCAVAALAVRAQPPQDSRLLDYGRGFADFLSNFAPAAELPYLPDVARLDRFWTEAHTAADATPLTAVDMAPLTPEQLGALHLRPHPSARWRWFDTLPIYTLWRGNRTPDAEMPAEIHWQPEGALITRPQDEVIWAPLAQGGAAFLDACAQGHALDHAAAHALAAQPDVDLSQLLAQLLRMGALMNAPDPKHPHPESAS